MRGWVDIATLAKPKNLNGGLVARGAAGLPFVLYPGLKFAIVPPVLDEPRTLTLARAEDRSDDEALVYFNEVPDLSAAESLSGCHLLVRADDIDLSALEDARELPHWEGWEIHDGKEGLIGTVESVDDRAFQPLLCVARPGGACVLIPLVEEFIVGVREAEHRIDVSLPAGLLDL